MGREDSKDQRPEGGGQTGGMRGRVVGGEERGKGQVVEGLVAVSKDLGFRLSERGVMGTFSVKEGQDPILAGYAPWLYVENRQWGRADGETCRGCCRNSVEVTVARTWGGSSGAAEKAPGPKHREDGVAWICGWTGYGWGRERGVKKDFKFWSENQRDWSSPKMGTRVGAGFRGKIRSSA